MSSEEMARINIRIPKDLCENIKALCKIQNLSFNEYVGKILYKSIEEKVDVNLQLITAISSLRQDVKHFKTDFDLYTMIFMQYLKYWFSFEHLKFEDYDNFNEKVVRYENESDEDFNERVEADNQKFYEFIEKLFETGNRRINESFIPNLKRENTNIKSIFENLAADYLQEEKE